MLSSAERISVDPILAKSLAQNLRRLADDIETGQREELYAPSVLEFEEGLAVCLLPHSTVVESENASALLSLISPKQRLVLARLIQGKSAKVIAFELSVSQRTVEHHIAAMLRTTKTQRMAKLLRLVHSRLF